VLNVLSDLGVKNESSPKVRYYLVSSVLIIGRGGRKKGRLPVEQVESPPDDLLVSTNKPDAMSHCVSGSKQHIDIYLVILLAKVIAIKFCIEEV